MDPGTTKAAKGKGDVYGRADTDAAITGADFMVNKLKNQKQHQNVFANRQKQKLVINMDGNFGGSPIKRNATKGSILENSPGKGVKQFK